MPKEFVKEAGIPVAAGRQWKPEGDGSFSIVVKRQAKFSSIEETFKIIHAGRKSDSNALWLVLYNPSAPSFDNSVTHTDVSEEEFLMLTGTHAFMLTLAGWDFINPRIDEADPEYFEVDLDKKTVTKVDAPDGQ